MKTLKYILSALVMASVLSSCVGDLEVTPIDPSLDTPDKVLVTEADYFALLAGCYTGFATSGYYGPNGGPSISGLDGGQSQYFRGLYHLNGVTTDEVVCGWNDDGMPDLSKASWNADNTFIKSFYYRVLHQVAIFNEFIRKVNEASIELPEAARWIAEARTLRAMCWLHAIDNFGNVPFATEESSVGSASPEQISRADLFAYIEKELTAVLEGSDLYDYAQGEYGRANKGLAAMVLAKLYLNAEVYLGKTEGAGYYQRCADVLAPLVGKYNLHTTSKGKYSAYEELFLADNHNCTDEIIFAIQQDGVNTQSWGVTQYLIFASTGGTMDAASLGISSGWGGLRTTPQFYDYFSETDARHLFFTKDVQDVALQKLYESEKAKYDKDVADGKDPEPLKPFDEWVATKEYHTKDIADMGKFENGYPIMKWKNMNSDGTPGQSNGFVDTDWPVYRYADALLMLAECELRGAEVKGSMTGKAAFDAVRARAGMAPIALTEANVLEERARELYQEGHRRSDLIRFGKFTKGYNWAWKGDNVNGQDVADHFVLFPIPNSDLNSNSNLEQNLGY